MIWMSMLLDTTTNTFILDKKFVLMDGFIYQMQINALNISVWRSPGLNQMNTASPLQEIG